MPNKLDTILDNYQNVALSMTISAAPMLLSRAFSPSTLADWSALDGRAAITVFNVANDWAHLTE